MNPSPADIAAGIPAAFQALNRLAETTWPAAETTMLGGWRARLDKGVTRRANSALPMSDDGSEPASMQIDRAEALYRGRKLAPCFMLSPGAQPSRLESELDRRGYRAEGFSEVMTLGLSPAVAKDNIEDLTLVDRPGEDWLAVYRTAEPSGFEVRCEIISRHPGPRCYALARLENRPAGVGFGVIADGWLGIAGMGTMPTARRRGCARRVLEALIVWACKQGAKGAYLQVEKDNAPAVALYSGLGFKARYPYHYRVLHD